MKPETSGGDLASHQAAFKSLALMSQVKTVMEVYDNESRYLTYYTTLIDSLRGCTYATVPAFIQSNAPRGNGGHGAQLNGTMDNVGGQPGPDVVGPQAMQNYNSGVNGGGNVPAGLNRVSFESQLGRELRTHEHGQAAVSATHADNHCDDDEDLFGSSSSNASGS